MAFKARRGGGMPPAYMRQGPAGTDLQNVNVFDADLTSRLSGAGLDVVRVERNQLTDAVTVVWRSVPGDEVKAIAEDLIGEASHVA